MRAGTRLDTVREVDQDLPPLFSRRRSPRFWVRVDAVLAVLFIAGGIAEVATEHRASVPGSQWDLLRYVAVLVVFVVLPWRRRYPEATLAVALAGNVVLSALGFQGPAGLALMLTTYSVAVTSDRDRSRIALAVVVAGSLLAAVVDPGGPITGSLISNPLSVLVAWVIGDNVRNRRDYARGQSERAAEREREREERILRAAADERLRIARELHDVVAHSMSIIAVQSGVGRMVIESQPDEARKALQVIETTSRQALHEMRLLLGVLRRPDEANSVLGPTPTLSDLDLLLGQVAQSGVVVRLRQEGVPRDLPPGVDLSAYRIIQEALTNIVRHVGPATAEVTIGYRAGEVDIEVNDDGGHRPANAGVGAGGANTGGQGLVGMRERVALFGGDLTAGAVKGGGFRVVARLPTAEGAS
jgi:signal transduction histidine kinase